uniref:Lipoprotein n=1 Tax=candidate division WOR-3 bacterium TaxID=2052148 RepID=A0A7V4E449_UNCW3
MKKAAFFIFLIFLACSLFKKEEEVMPLEVDNWWAYQVTTQGKMMPKEILKAFKKFSSPGTYIDTMRIIGKQTIEGVDGYVNYSTYNEDTTGIFYYKNDYLWYYYPDEKISEKVFPQKPKIGDSWVGYEEKEDIGDWDMDGINDSMAIKTEYTIISKENINVIAGSFKDAYRTQIVASVKVWYSSSNQWQTEAALTGTIWLKTNVGILKMEIPEFETQELMAYKVK